MKITDIPDWEKPGVQFGWVKFTNSSRFLPAFIFPLEKGAKIQKARQLLSNGVGKLAEKSRDVDCIASESQVKQAKKSDKSKPYLAALKQFNLNNKTNF